MNQFKDSFQLNKEEVKEAWYKKVSNIYLLLLIIVISLSLGFLFGLNLNNKENKPTVEIIKETTSELSNLFKNSESIDSALFSELWNIIHDNYFDQPMKRGWE